MPLPRPVPVMPRFCHSCGYSTPDVWADQCPRCQRPMAITSQTAVGSPGSRPRRPRSARRVLIVVVLLVLAVPAAGLGVLYLAPTVFLKTSGDADSTGQVRVGMRPAEVAQVLGIAAQQRGFAGSIVWARDGRLLRVRFESGRVVRVEEGTLPVPITLTRVTADPG